MKRCKLRNSRPKALFGSEAAAILAAAGINVAGTMAGAALQNKATVDAAKQQAEATKAQAREQVKALQQQNENNKQLQERSIEITKEQNEENRDLQREIQMNLQLLTGQQNQAARNEASKIVVRNGGSLRSRGYQHSPLRGGNIPFRVTDGGGVLPLGQTPEGYDLYEIIGNDHEHYHKTKGGKQKSGVGFKFVTGEEVEGEGNQNARKGELLLVTPTDAKFISKHSIDGFNPADAVFAGVHPVEAFNIQEQIKAERGIMDNGKKPCRKLRTIGGLATSYYGIPDVAITPDFSTDIVTPTATGVAYITQQNAETNPNNMNYGSTSKYNVAKYGCSTRKKAKDGINTSYILGAGLNTLGNIGGALISGIGNNRALKYITNANTEAAKIMANAYSQLKGIDPSLIRREDFAAPHAMVAVQAPIVNTNTQRTLANRSLLRQQEAINKNGVSAAAAQNIQALAEANYNDTISEIENQANKERQAIIQGNMERITQGANNNANRDIQANSDYYGHYLNALESKVDTDNLRILGAADALSSALTNNASAISNTIQSNAAGLASAVRGSADSWASAAQNIGDNKFRERALLLTADEGVYDRVQQKLKEEEAARQERIENRRRKLRNMPVFRWMYKTGAN